MDSILIKDIEIPSVNHYLGRTKSGRTYLAEQAKEFKKLIAIYCRDFELRKDNVSIEFSWFINHNRRSDLDNRLKVLLDSLSGIAYLDDKQVVEIHAKKIKTNFNGLEIKIDSV